MSDTPLVLFREDSRLTPYQHALEAAGIEASYRLPSADLEMQSFTALVLTGGTDVNPELYHQSSRPETDPPDVERDICELRLIGQALQLDLPVLAICRGMQILNVSRGGTLQQHLPDDCGHRSYPSDRAEPAHSVALEPDSVIAAVCRSLTLDVNSRHHQALDRLGEGLRVTARSPDGIIEAVECVDKLFVVAVQWHPEDQVFRYREQLQLFTYFGAVVNRRSRAHHK